MQHRHSMPFGAEPGAEGTRFRLWAPTAREVALCVEGRQPLVLERDQSGWCQALVPEVGPGARYRYLIDGELPVPDPASRYQPDGVHGASVVVAPTGFDWPRAAEWRGRPWHEAVLYELHLGTFSPEGTYLGAIERLDHLLDLGVTALQLMPLSATPGRRNWGYDGVAPFAPEAAYGTPDELKALLVAAHRRGLMVLLDVVYNHFGPEGNYLHRYAEPFFSERHHTPWGAAINYDGEGSRVVRDFVIHNALYWLEEYRFDGLRLDAVDRIHDDSEAHILVRLAAEVRRRTEAGRHVHLLLENDDNRSDLLDELYAAQYNDDIHHALHVLVSGEKDGYYRDYAAAPERHLGRCLAEGFAYQGEVSIHRHGARRGQPSAHLPPTAFVAFLQNHDQVGNRARGERLHHYAPPEAVLAAAAIVLLSPSIPLLFMGEEWGADTPFQFFCAFEPALAESVRNGRRREFAAFDAFDGGDIPDPLAESTFECSRLDWRELDEPEHQRWLGHYRTLLRLRHQVIVPLLRRVARARHRVDRGGVVHVEWGTTDGARLLLVANLSPSAVPAAKRGDGTVLWRSWHDSAPGMLPPWAVGWFLTPGRHERP